MSRRLRRVVGLIASASRLFGRGVRRSIRLDVRRSARLAASLLLLPALAACGEVFIQYDSRGCTDEVRYAVTVEFRTRDGRAVDVDASGLVTDGPYSETMVPVSDRASRPGRTFALSGGRDRGGVYDVRVTTATGERFDWLGVRVARDWCGPYTVLLQAVVIAG